MARYYESEALIEFVKQNTPNMNGETTMKCVEFAIKNAPTADVVPKSEVDRLVDKWIGSGELTPDEKTLRLIEALRDEARRYERYYFNHEYDKLIAEAKSEVAREIFEEIERMCIDTFGNFNHRVFAELKKKYTEASDD